MPLRPAAAAARMRALALLLACSLAACRNEPEPVRETLHVFGSLTEIEVRGVTPEQAQAAVAAASEHLNQLNREWHAWEDSDLTRINLAFARGQSATAPPSVVELIKRSRPLAEASEGLFDPAIGGLVRLWGFHTSDFPVRTPAPGTDAINTWRQSRPRLSDVAVEGNAVASRNPAVQLDFGAIAEGAAAEQIARIFTRHGVKDALFSLGGDVYGMGSAGGRPWQVGLRDPYGEVLGWVELHSGEALFNTGNYAKFRETPSGARWGHILDPRTGFPARGAAAVAVLHPDPVVADAAATALFAGGPSMFAHLVGRLGTGCALMITDENEILITTAMQRRARMLRSPVMLGEPVTTGESCVGPRR